MSGRYYQLNQKVLANCGTKRKPEWIPGVVIYIEGTYSVARPYRIRLERESDGKEEWFFPRSYVMADTPRNRRNNL